MKLFIHIIYFEKVRSSNFGYTTWKNNENRQKFCMAATRYISPMLLVPTYLKQ